MAADSPPLLPLWGQAPAVEKEMGQLGSVENMLSNILWGTDTHVCAVKS